ncbi:RING-type E3 ubiquitin transferase [Trifolium repens]|nr:RING-type E3 ubiquitin transferase [Trifolium repens]
MDIAFPFDLIDADQYPRCSYFPNPFFQLSCNSQNQTILNLPETNNLIIKNIDYKTQTIKVNDPKGCLAKRYLDDNFDLSDSPFKLNPEIYNLNLTFLRCPSNITTVSSSSSFQFPLTPISCLSNDEKYSNLSSSSIVVLWAPPLANTTLIQMCEVISTAFVPLPWKDVNMWPFWRDINSDVELVWTDPRCGGCALNGQVCGFSEDFKNNLQVQCFDNSSNEGLSRSAKYGIAIGVGIPILVCLIGFACFCCGKMRTTLLDEQRSSSNVPTISISLEPLPFFVTGLDGATIEKYPKILIGESGRLLKPNDNTCSICLSEYQPKETLRSIPECNHYFHVACIDEWLKMNGTCPICRNSLEAYSTTGPYLASLLLSPNSSSLSTSR